jgi:hypothetical protein
LTNHDHDALYVTGLAGDGRSAAGKQPLSFPASVPWLQCVGVGKPRPGACADRTDPPDVPGGLPLYLRVSSLRI